MLNKFQASDVARIRNAYYGHVLYTTLSKACLSCCEEVKSYQLRPEQILVEVVFLIDELKQQQQDIQWNNLYRSLRQDYQIQDNAISSNDCDRIATTIVCTLASILAVSYTNVYHRLAQKLFNQIITSKSFLSEQALNDLMNGIEERNVEIAQWLWEYMESDTFESDAFTEYFSPIEMSEKGTPQHIRFSPKATTEQKSEFKSLIYKILSQKKKRGIAGEIRALLRKSVMDEIIVLSGTDKDIYDDLHDYFGYTQSYSTFMEAEPKLIKKQD